MGGTRSPGTVGYTWLEEIDAGTSARVCMAVPAAAVGRSDRERFESAVQALESELANIGATSRSMVRHERHMTGRSRR